MNKDPRHRDRHTHTHTHTPTHTHTHHTQHKDKADTHRHTDRHTQTETETKTETDTDTKKTKKQAGNFLTNSLYKNDQLVHFLGLCRGDPSRDTCQSARATSVRATARRRERNFT